MIVLEKQGNEAAGLQTSDIRVKLTTVDHPDYKRLGDDLIFTKKISLIDALEQRPCTF